MSVEDYLSSTEDNEVYRVKGNGAPYSNERQDILLFSNQYYDFDPEWVCEDEESFDMFHDEDTAKIFWRRV